MRGILICLGLAAILFAAPAASQNRSKPSLPSAAPTMVLPGDRSSIAGTWTYRSFINTTEQVGDDPGKALRLIFGEGVFTLETPSGGALKGTFDMGGGFVLDLQGAVRQGGQGAPLTVEFVGNGRADTPTAGWEYDYHAYLAHQWPKGVNQAVALVGTVIRAKPHDGAPAGFVASFIAVKQR